jgi:hypothetical protein
MARLVHLFMLSCYLASHLATVPHAHRTDSIGHTTHKHFHTGLVLISSDHHGHQHGSGPHESPADVHGEVNELAAVNPLAPHSTDAIEIPDVDDASSKAFGIDVSMSTETSGRVYLSSPLRKSNSHSDIGCRSCALIVKLRNLRI